MVQRQPHLLKSSQAGLGIWGIRKSSYRNFLVHKCPGVSTQGRSSALTFPDLCPSKGWKFTPGFAQQDTIPLTKTCALWQESPPCFPTGQSLSQDMAKYSTKGSLSHVQLDSHTLKRLKNFRILPSAASGPPWDVTPTMAFFHLLGRGLCAQEVNGHQQLSESMLKKSSSHPTPSTLISMKLLEHPPLLSQPKQQKSSNLSLHKLLPQNRLSM